jgi:hypothetical protein
LAAPREDLVKIDVNLTNGAARAFSPVNLGTQSKAV